MAQRGLSESGKTELRKADAEAKLQFIKFAAVPPALARQPPPLRGASLRAEAPSLQGAHRAAGGAASEQPEGQGESQRARQAEREEAPGREDSRLLRPRAPTTVPRALPQRDTERQTERQAERGGEGESRARPVPARPQTDRDRQRQTETDRDRQRDRQIPERPAIPARPLPTLPARARP